MSVAEAEAEGGSRGWLRPLASLALTAALCFVLLRRVDVRELADWLVRVDRRYYAVYVVLSFAGLLARAFRYRLLLGRTVGFVPLALVTAARNFLVDLLPARIGSLSYVYLLTRRFGAPLDPVLSSFILTFLYDLLAMTVLLGVALVLELGRFEAGATLGIVTAIFAILVVAVFIRLAPSLRFAAARLHLVARPWARSVALRLDDVADEVERSGGARQTVVLTALSVLIRLLKFAAYWSLLLGVVREHGLAAADLPFWKVFLGIAGAELSATLPIHGIAGFGTYETAWALGFTRLGLSSRVAILSGFATHLLSQLYDYSVGLVALAIALAWSRRAA
ncbi:MAG TPA: lysylphosphatidylglycerol synthase transmembrane domain-containing protein [Candidatus Binatia bacterium]|nr:lysylphosphatidylglycerol synthase transmembrane domain-containing protein [Candidatus Binatia bacterium]